MTKDLRTATEKERDARHKVVCNKFKKLADANPDVAPSRIFDAIGHEIGMTLQAVRNICISNGLYTPKTR